jgi:hypothetical protein
MLSIQSSAVLSDALADSRIFSRVVTRESAMVWWLTIWHQPCRKADVGFDMNVDFMKLREAALFTPPAPNINCPSIISYNTNKMYEDGMDHWEFICRLASVQLRQYPTHPMQSNSKRQNPLITTCHPYPSLP